MQKNFIAKAYFNITLSLKKKPKSDEEKLIMLANSMTKEIFESTFQGRKLNSSEISLVTGVFKESVKARLVQQGTLYEALAKEAIESANKL